MESPVFNQIIPIIKQPLTDNPHDSGQTFLTKGTTLSWQVTYLGLVVGVVFISLSTFSPHGNVWQGAFSWPRAVPLPAAQGRRQRQTWDPKFLQLRTKIVSSVCICVWSVAAPRPQIQRMLFASCSCGCVWELWCIFLHSLWIFHFSLLSLLSPQSFRPNGIPINDELSVTNHCLLFPAMPLFVNFTLQKQLNQWKGKIYI